MFKLFKHKETDEEMRNRILKLCKDGDYGLCAPPMDAQTTVNELAKYILGEDWYTVMPYHNEQINTEIVYAIESKLKNKI